MHFEDRKMRSKRSTSLGSLPYLRLGLAKTVNSILVYVGQICTGIGVAWDKEKIRWTAPGSFGRVRDDAVLDIKNMM
jgi:hypothetical protein